jgi:hypothetical protein
LPVVARTNGYLNTTEIADDTVGATGPLLAAV